MAVIKKEAYFMSSNGHTKIRTLIWENDETEHIGIFQIAHGLSEHIDRYDEFARFLAADGFIVCGNDHIGHGKSASTFDELGDFGEEDTYVRMIDDMHILHNIMIKRNPGLPYYLFGHSMGSFCARLYAQNFGYELSGLIICGTGNFSDKFAPLEIAAELAADKLGRDRRSDAASEIFGTVTSKIYGDQDIRAWLSLSRANRENFSSDPLCGGEITLGSSLTVMKLALKSSSKEWYDTFPVELPVLLISGAKDSIGMFGRGVLQVCDGLESRGVETEMILYPGMRHEILNEDDREKVFGDIRKWLYMHLNAYNM